MQISNVNKFQWLALLGIDTGKYGSNSRSGKSTFTYFSHVHEKMKKITYTS